MRISEKGINIITVIITLIICYFPLCHNIGSYSIQMWDEGRNVANAVEMIHNHHWFTRYFENKPDMWELKPPFIVWCQVISFKIFGLSELSARIPSMFFSISTVLFLIWMGYKITGKMHSGIAASLILVSTLGYTGIHVARFGDHDVFLTFFSTVLVCMVYLYFKTQRPTYMILAFVALFFGWFTKSIVIFMFLPVILTWAIANRHLKAIVLNKGFWLCLGILLCCMTSYYLIREDSSPGYVLEVWMNELFPRYMDKSYNYHYHQSDFWDYPRRFFVDERFDLFFILFMLGSFFVLLRSELPHRHFLLYLMLHFFVFLVIISAGSKNFWYDAPLFPIAALFLGILTDHFYHLFKKRAYKAVFVLLFLSLIIYPSYSRTLKYALDPDPWALHPLESVSYYLMDEDHKLPHHLKVIHNSIYTPSPLCYYAEKVKARNTRLILLKEPELEPNDTFLISDKFFNEKVDSFYTTGLIHAGKACQLRKVIGPKITGK